MKNTRENDETAGLRPIKGGEGSIQALGVQVQSGESTAAHCKAGGNRSISQIHSSSSNRISDGKPEAKTDSRRRGSISILDVAQAADVSIATVSRVLNTPAVVSGDTSRRVLDAVQRLGYVPNPFAKGLITRSSRVLGLALPDLHGEFYSGLLRGADEAARREGYHLLVSSEARANGGRGARELGAGLVDGLALMVTEPDQALVREARQTRLPLVVLDTQVDEPGVDSVIVDNAVGAEEATRHLVAGTPADLLYFVGGAPSNFDTARRAEAFANVLLTHGHVARGDQMAFGDYTPEWGATWMRSVVARNGQRSEIGAGSIRLGVLAANDEIALGVLQAAIDLGLRVPEDVRVVGFDDTRLACLLRPRLSSVRVPLLDIGAAAIRALMKRIEEPELEPRVITMKTELVIRESSKFQQ